MTSGISVAGCCYSPRRDGAAGGCGGVEIAVADEAIVRRKRKNDPIGQTCRLHNATVAILHESRHLRLQVEFAFDDESVFRFQFVTFVAEVLYLQAGIQ
jgi:hypothetical protein